MQAEKIVLAKSLWSLLNEFNWILMDVVTSSPVHTFRTPSQAAKGLVLKRRVACNDACHILSGTRNRLRSSFALE